MRIPKLFCITAAAAIITLASCSSDDNTGSNKDTNTNRNNTTTNKYAGGLEYPKTKDSAGSIVIVHSTDMYGVNYSIEWDCQKKAQRWTCFQMYSANSVTNWSRNEWKDAYWDGREWEGDPFQEDRAIPAQYRTTLADYRGSGYNRGHICASADRLCSMDANGQTFYLSNMHPQHYNFNAKLWAKMEAKLRSWNTKNMRDTLFVCKGGTIADYGSTKGVKGYTGSGLIVPKYFFMAILCKKGSTLKTLGFWAEHENIDRSADNLKDYVVSIGELERLTGIDFFCNLPDQEEQRLQNMAKENILKAWGLNSP